MRVLRRSAPDREQPINLTPMLDVVFIMLIFFVVAATFVKEVGLDVPTPQPSAQVNPERTSILVSIDARDRIVVAGRDTDRRLVRAQLERLRAENPDASLVIKPHADATAAVIVGVMDAANAARIANVSLGV